MAKLLRHLVFLADWFYFLDFFNLKENSKVFQYGNLMKEFILFFEGEFLGNSFSNHFADNLSERTFRNANFTVGVKCSTSNSQLKFL